VLDVGRFSAKDRFCRIAAVMPQQNFALLPRASQPQFWLKARYQDQASASGANTLEGRMGCVVALATSATSCPLKIQGGGLNRLPWHPPVKIAIVPASHKNQQPTNLAVFKNVL